MSRRWFSRRSRKQFHHPRVLPDTPVVINLEWYRQPSEPVRTRPVPIEGGTFYGLEPPAPPTPIETVFWLRRFVRQPLELPFATGRTRRGPVIGETFHVDYLRRHVRGSRTTWDAAAAWRHLPPYDRNLPSQNPDIGRVPPRIARPPQLGTVFFAGRAARADVPGSGLTANPIVPRTRFVRSHVNPAEIIRGKAWRFGETITDLSAAPVIPRHRMLHPELPRPAAKVIRSLPKEFALPPSVPVIPRHWFTRQILNPRQLFDGAVIRTGTLGPFVPECEDPRLSTEREEECRVRPEDGCD